MKKRKLKGYVLPTIYSMVVLVTMLSITFMSSTLFNEKIEVEQKENFVEGKEDVVTPVIKENDNNPVMPYNSKDVSVIIDYYNQEDAEDIQVKSLLYYKNTYLQNTGILYGSETKFEIICTLDGVVKEVDNDEILGLYVEVEHDNGYKSFYYSLSDVKVKLGDKLSKSDIIGSSGTSKLDNCKPNNLIYEVYYNDRTIDPNNFYKTVIKEER